MRTGLQNHGRAEFRIEHSVMTTCLMVASVPATCPVPAGKVSRSSPEPAAQHPLCVLTCPQHFEPGMLINIMAWAQLTLPGRPCPHHQLLTLNTLVQTTAMEAESCPSNDCQRGHCKSGAPCQGPQDDLLCSHKGLRRFPGAGPAHW